MAFHLHLLDTIYTQQQLRAALEGEVFQTPHVALAGRSNVGKSTLINHLAGRKALAKISATPGKTRSINCYRVEPQGFMLVDLPGYGYAKRSKAEREQWKRLIEEFLVNSPELKAVALLLDCRIEPQANDQEMGAFLTQSRLPLLPVLTKADKCKQRDRSHRQKQWMEILRQNPPLLFSGTTGLGAEALREALTKLALGA
ncbi:MAG: GTP-binding protein [Desulfovibrionales bacterium]|jgi:GTP-binding protein|nr:GTP-binding protein [Desulfovibrionales bacterium]